MKIVFNIVLLLLLGFSLSAQTSDVSEGCSPLRVRFSAEQMSQYYWDFNDGGISNDQNPEYFFVNPGVYLVKLREGQNGAQVGEIEITVYAEPELDISFDKTEGCLPLSVNFSSIVTVDSNVPITGYKWTFGDGNTSNDQNPQYVYNTPGKYTVSFEVTSSYRGCNKTEIFFDIIEVFGVEADFNIISGGDCELPFQYGFNNLTENKQGNTYLWDFGNGQTSTEYNPGSIQYDTEGEFTIKLRVTTINGCVIEVEKSINIGVNKFTLGIPDSTCININIPITNGSTGNYFRWQFGQGSNISNSSLRVPTLRYSSGGEKTITLVIGDNPNCRKDTTFTIFIENPTAVFEVDPVIACYNPMIYEITAIDSTYAEYYWNGSSDPKGFMHTDTFIPLRRRDSFHMNFIDEIYVGLRVVSHLGCVATWGRYIANHRPDAYIVSTETRGCAPLEVTFKDTTLTHVPVIYRKWIFGDGTEIESGGNQMISHTFNDPGEYYVVLIIENAHGCRDTSTGTWVYVGEPIDPLFTLDKYEICLGDTINVDFSNLDPRIDALHLSTDDGRFQHCWKDSRASHAFITEPGFFDVTGTVEYNGCYTDVFADQQIHVKGAKANIGYKINCDSPLNVDFSSKSFGADQLLWNIDGVFYTSEEFVHAFPVTGDYTIVLEATDVASGCPANLDSTVVYVRQIQANVVGDTILCYLDEYFFDASGSIDVDVECSKGYFWDFSFQRPWETMNPIYQNRAILPVGRQHIFLTVEDTNGCKDTDTLIINVYDVYANFEVSDGDICFPANVSFTNTTTADTTILWWEWFNGDDQWNTSEFFTQAPIPNPFRLVVEDVIGCRDTFDFSISHYKPTTTITLNPGNTICRGNQLNLSATDFTVKGSSLEFDWTIGDFFTSDIRTPSLILDQTGIFPITLIYTEIGSNCVDSILTSVEVIETPMANFTSDVESLPLICHPRIINFINESETEGTVNYLWNFRDNATSTLENPSEGFPKGEHEVTLIVTSIFGCADTLSRNYVLVGPEGGITFDRSPICTNQELILGIVDTADVFSYQWQFGDGQAFENQSPVAVSFNPDPSVTSIPVRIIFLSGMGECELIVEDVISYFALIADFEIKDTISCQGEVFLENLSTGASEYIWSFGDGTTSGETHPMHTYNQLGEQSIQLISIANDGACRDSITYITNLEEDNYEVKFPNVFTPNGDGQNDFFRLNIDEELKEYIEFLEFQVINRWGDVVFNNETPGGWDGNYKGQPAPAEIYAYRLVARIKGCDIVSKKGNVTLIR